MNTPRQGGLAQRSPEAKISRKQAKPQSPQSARSTPAEASHHRANHTMAGPIPAPRRATGAAGHPLSAAQRERFAPIVGPAATQAARVHTSTDAHAWAQHQQARAVADGVDIYFAGGEYRPGTLGGDTLIAHELVHVRQALLGRLHRPARWATVGAEQTATEAEADDAARQVTEEPAAEQVQKQTEETQPGADNQAAPPTTSPAAVTTAQATQTGTAVPEAAVGPAAESQVAVEGEAAAAIDQAAPKGALPADIPLMPEPQTALSPDEKRRVSGVQGRAAATTKSTATAPQPTEDVASAAKAVATPQAESNAQAAEAIVAELGDTVKPSVEIVALCDRIKKLIREKRPADEEGVIDSRPEEVASTAGGAVSGDVNKNVDSAKGSYGPIDSTPKGPQPQQPPGVDPLPAQAPTADVSAKAATPDAVPPEQVSLDGDTKQMEAKADQAGLNKESAQLVQGGPVAEARAARGEMGELSKDGPAEAIKQQNEALATADANMAALQLKALQSLRDARAGHVAGVGTQQQELKGGAEDLRTRLSNKAQGIYDSAQTRVQDLLRDVPTTAMDKWTKGLPPISRQFKADLKVVADRVDERHSGVGGFFVAGWDAVSGLPDWATDAYDKAEKDFGDSVCTLITGISVYVNQIIKIADEIIADARKEISAVFKAELPEADAAWAAEQEKAFGHKLDALHDKAEETRTSFNKELIDNAGGAVQSAREEIQKLRKKAGGLWGRFLDAVGRFLDDPVKFIIDGLLELVGISPPAFWALVKKIEKVLTDIVDAPIRFANNLMDGVAKGFSLFFDNIGIHLVTGLLEWLLSGLKDEGIPIQVPKEFSVKSVIGFFLESARCLLVAHPQAAGRAARREARRDNGKDRRAVRHPVLEGHRRNPRRHQAIPRPGQHRQHDRRRRGQVHHPDADREGRGEDTADVQPGGRDLCRDRSDLPRAEMDIHQRGQALPLRRGDRQWDSRHPQRQHRRGRQDRGGRAGHAGGAGDRLPRRLSRPRWAARQGRQRGQGDAGLGRRRDAQCHQVARRDGPKDYAGVGHRWEGRPQEEDGRGHRTRTHHSVQRRR